MKIRAYLSGDEKEIMALDERALPSIWNRRTLQNWQWKYTKKNPAGKSIIWVANHKDQMVAHFAAVPFTLKTFNQSIKASHSIGALVENKYQNRGLLKLVGDKMLEDLSQQNIHYTWGFPNARAYQFEKVALGYHDLINFNQWEIKKEKLNRTPPPNTFQKVTRFNEQFNDLWDQCENDYNVIIQRDSAYLNWRFIQRPDWWYFPYAVYSNENKLKGYVVLKLYREENTLRGHIIDIFAKKDDRETLSTLIDGSMSFFAEQCVDEITVWFTGNPLIEELFKEKNWQEKEIDRPLILKVNTNHETKEKVLDKANWYFTMSDSTEIF